MYKWQYKTYDEMNYPWQFKQRRNNKIIFLLALIDKTKDKMLLHCYDTFIQFKTFAFYLFVDSSVSLQKQGKARIRSGHSKK